LFLLFGRAGGVIGAFLASGVLHHVMLLGIDPSSEMWRMLLPFGMMGVGVVLEHAVAGNNMGGWRGRMWTMFWLGLWANVIVDGWARAGVLGAFSSPTSVRQPIERLVRSFDNYLHTC